MIAPAEHARIAPQPLTRRAPAVSRAAGAGDPEAPEIVRKGARHLVAAAARVHRSENPGVFAGSVLTSEGSPRSAVRQLLTEQGGRTGPYGGRRRRGGRWDGCGEAVDPVEAPVHASPHATFTGVHPSIAAFAPAALV
ncbi:hypothetical protein [Streptomyces sp. SID9727]|uniref:hypothetical protein n=1 Tax=Streptomyces sp. SID9727 TaxID=2706114 RepID=UPI0013C5F2EB|nr:hypothetical protein [Streptomyces sp. SID9727]NEC64644.1 hypothetical protein [Streptomyces sp. SID9727]